MVSCQEKHKFHVEKTDFKTTLAMHDKISSAKSHLLCQFY